MTDRILVEGQRLCSVDLYYLYGDIARNASKLGNLRQKAILEKFWLLEDEFATLFEIFFGTFDEWSAVFDSQNGVIEWWQQATKTTQYQRSCQLVAEMKQVLLECGIRPEWFEQNALLKASMEIDGALAQIWLKDELHAVVLQKPYGWLELRLIGLTFPDEKEDTRPKPS